MEIETRSQGELCVKLEQITLRGSNIQPYLKSYIDIITTDPLFLSPAQRYVLTDELKKIEQLAWDVESEYGRSIFKLNGYLKCKYDDKTIDILPPVVEEFIDEKGKLHMIIADGMHRCYLARQRNELINVVYVRGVHPGYPYYAYPLPDGWAGVQLINKLDKNYIKKFHVAKEYKKLFRSFNTQFSNIGDSRKCEGE